MNRKIKLFLIVIGFLLMVGLIIYLKSKPKYFSGNDDSILLVNEYLESLTKSLDDREFEYTFQKSRNKKVDSVIVKIEQKSDNNDYIIPIYVSYNVDRKTHEILNKEQIASYYGYSLEEIIDRINERLNIYYDEEIKLGYVDPNECSFEQYKNFYRNIEDIEDIYELYVKNDKLYIYIGFDRNSIMEDLDYFNNLEYDPFKIEL